jgi:hypothetical protein
MGVVESLSLFSGMVRFAVGGKEATRCFALFVIVGIDEC